MLRARTYAEPRASREVAPLVHALLDDEEMPKRPRRAIVPLRRLVLGLLGLALALVAHREGTAQAPPTETLVFPAVADTYVDASLPTTNFNADGRLKADASPVRVSYLRFTVAGLDRRPVVQARVRLQVNSTLADTGGTIHRITDNGWDEGTLPHETRPPARGPGLSPPGPLPPGDAGQVAPGPAAPP